MAVQESKEAGSGLNLPSPLWLLEPVFNSSFGAYVGFGLFAAVWFVVPYYLWAVTKRAGDGTFTRWVAAGNVPTGGWNTFDGLKMRFAFLLLAVVVGASFTIPHFGDIDGSERWRSFQHNLTWFSGLLLFPVLGLLVRMSTGSIPAQVAEWSTTTTMSETNLGTSTGWLLASLCAALLAGFCIKGTSVLLDNCVEPTAVAFTGGGRYRRPVRLLGGGAFAAALGLGEWGAEVIGGTAKAAAILFAVALFMLPSTAASGDPEQLASAISTIGLVGTALAGIVTVSRNRLIPFESLPKLQKRRLSGIFRTLLLIAEVVVVGALYLAIGIAVGPLAGFAALCLKTYKRDAGWTKTYGITALVCVRRVDRRVGDARSRGMSSIATAAVGLPHTHHGTINMDP